MTVAAVILAATPASALVDADGTPAVRRLADVAWAGGATPIVVVAPDPDGDVARALATSEVTLAEPAPREAGPVGQIARGIAVTRDLVIETEAVLVWPARHAWVDAETVTSLIAAHGRDRGAMVRPAFGGEVGFPTLVPAEWLDGFRGIDPTLMPDAVLPLVRERMQGAEVVVEVGDPGVTHDIGTPRTSLPPYDGPPEPADADAPEWGAAAADQPDDAPLDGPPVAPYRDPSVEA